MMEDDDEWEGLDTAIAESKRTATANNRPGESSRSNQLASNLTGEPSHSNQLASNLTGESSHSNQLLKDLERYMSDELFLVYLHLKDYYYFEYGDI